jgi:hypothetical protein
MMYEELAESIKIAIEQGRSDIVRSLLEACDKGMHNVVTRRVI